MFWLLSHNSAVFGSDPALVRLLTSLLKERWQCPMCSVTLRFLRLRHLARQNHAVFEILHTMEKSVPHIKSKNPSWKTGQGSSRRSSPKTCFPWREMAAQGLLSPCMLFREGTGENCKQLKTSRSCTEGLMSSQQDLPYLYIKVTLLEDETCKLLICYSTTPPPQKKKALILRETDRDRRLEKIETDWDRLGQIENLRKIETNLKSLDCPLVLTNWTSSAGVARHTGATMLVLLIAVKGITILVPVGSFAILLKWQIN